MRSIAFIVLVVASGFARAGCGDHAVMTAQKEDGTTVGVVITDEQYRKQPLWKIGSGEPPLALTKAVDAATAWAKKTYKKYDDIRVQSVSLSPIGCLGAKDKWYYLVTFSPVIDGNSLYGSGYFAAVLMDSTVIGPTPVKSDF